MSRNPYTVSRQTANILYFFFITIIPHSLRLLQPFISCSPSLCDSDFYTLARSYQLIGCYLFGSLVLLVASADCKLRCLSNRFNAYWSTANEWLTNFPCTHYLTLGCRYLGVLRTKSKVWLSLLGWGVTFFFLYINNHPMMALKMCQLIFQAS